MKGPAEPMKSLAAPMKSPAEAMKSPARPMKSPAIKIGARALLLHHAATPKHLTIRARGHSASNYPVMWLCLMAV